MFRSRGVALLCLLATSCAPLPAPLADVIVPPRSTALIGGPAVRCLVGGNGDPQSSTAFDVFQDASGGFAVAQVRLPASAPAVLSNFTAAPSQASPPAQARRALARFEKRGVRLSGWVDLDKRTFTVRSRVSILGENLWAEPGTLVRLWGSVDSERLLASAPSPFDEPKRVAFAVPCELVEYGRTTPKPSQVAPRGSRAHASPGRLDFFDGPDGAPLFSATSKGFLAVQVLERQLDRVHVIIGNHPISTENGTLFAQGWIPAKRLGKPPAESNDRDSHGGILDGQDKCPLAPTARDTEILLGSRSPGLAVALLEAGTRIQVVERRGEFAAIELESGIFGPPAGSRWWIHSSAIEDECSAARARHGADADGCPDCPAD